MDVIEHLHEGSLASWLYVSHVYALPSRNSELPRARFIVSGLRCMDLHWWNRSAGFQVSQDRFARWNARALFHLAARLRGQHERWLVRRLHRQRVAHTRTLSAVEWAAQTPSLSPGRRSTPGNAVCSIAGGCAFFFWLFGVP